MSDAREWLDHCRYQGEDSVTRDYAALIARRLDSLSAQNADLQARAERAEAEQQEAEEWMGAVRAAWRAATGGNTTFIDDDVARAVQTLTAELDAARQEAASLRQALAALQAAVRGIRVSAYPARGSGFVAIVEGGLDEALALAAGPP